MAKYSINDIGGTVAKEDDRYRVCDNSELKKSSFKQHRSTSQ